MKRLAIGLPMGWPFVHREFFFSFIQLMVVAKETLNVDMFYCSSALVEMMREVIADRARLNSDYILLLDTDQTYPQDIVPRLRKYIDDGLMIVGGMTPEKWSGEPLVFDEQMVQQKKFRPHQGLVKVGAMGLGGVMINPKVFEIVPPPWFERIKFPDYEVPWGEDASFFWRCRQKGIDLWCDTDMTFGHIKTMITEFPTPEELKNGKCD